MDVESLRELDIRCIKGQRVLSKVVLEKIRQQESNEDKFVKIINIINMQQTRWSAVLLSRRKNGTWSKKADLAYKRGK